MYIGYARVSTKDQNLDLQKQALNESGRPVPAEMQHRPDWGRLRERKIKQVKLFKDKSVIFPASSIYRYFVTESSYSIPRYL